MIKKVAYKGMLFLITAQILVGINIITSKILLSKFPILILLEIRFILATFVLFLLHLFLGSQKKTLVYWLGSLKRRDWYFILAQAMCAGVLFNILMYLGLRHTDANVAGIITSALPAVIAIMSWLMLGEKPSSQKALCIASATMGLVIIAYGKLYHIGPGHSFFGDSIVFISLLPEAMYYVLCKLYASQLPVFLISALLNAINALVLFPALLIVYWEPYNINVYDWLIVFIIGLSSGLFYVFWLKGTHWVDSIMASLSTAMMPVSTVILAWLVLNEGMSTSEFVGMACVLASIVFYAKK